MFEEEKEKEEIDDVEAEIMADLEDLDNELDDVIHETGEDSTEGVDESSESNLEPTTPAEEKELQEQEVEETFESQDLEEGDGEGEKASDEASLEEESEEEEETFLESDLEGEGNDEISEEDELSTEEVESSAEDEHSKKKNIVEGALFVAGRPVSVEELNIKTEIKKREISEFLNELAMEYLMRSTALEIVQIQDKYSLQIKPEFTPNVKKFASGGLIPDKHLKTLTIIALKQPILKSTLVKIRGSGAYDHVKFLLDRGFIELFKKGRSHEIITTEQFADTFGLSRDIQTLKKQMITQLGINEPKK